MTSLSTSAARWLVALAAAASCTPVAGAPTAPASPPLGPASLAPVDTSPARPPPALHAAAPVAPPLPDLPAVSADAAQATAPVDAGLDRHACRAVWTGSGAAPLSCGHSHLFGTSRDGAVVLVPRELLRRPPSSLPAYVDHRLDGTEGPTRYQGDAPACTAFATATALDNALARWSGVGAAVSVMEIWSRYHSPLLSTSLSANIGHSLASEDAWPFDVTSAMSWVPCEMYSSPPSQGCGKPVDATLAKEAAHRPLGEFTEVEYLQATPPDIHELESKLAAGQDLMVVMELPTAFVPKGKPGALYIPHYKQSDGPESGHAFVLAGYARLPKETYFLMHNSWGDTWGDGGYVWLHEATVTMWMREVLAIDAEPVQRAPGSRPRRRRGQTTCSGDLVADSITGVCSLACPDQSPRHDSVCAIPGQCPAGYVNLTGVCVLAAPPARGTDPKTGISWSCGPGGCSYDVPHASDPECTGAVCRASCPAPDFHIARMKDRLVCVE